MQSSFEEHVKLTVGGSLEERDHFKCNENVYAENNTNTLAKIKASH